MKTLLRKDKELSVRIEKLEDSPGGNIRYYISLYDENSRKFIYAKITGTDELDEKEVQKLESYLGGA